METSTLDQQIKDLSSKFDGNPGRVANALGLGYLKVKSRMIHLGLFNSNSEFKEHHNGKGRPEMRPFLISRKKSTWEKWPDADAEKIATAHKRYDLGLVDIATGRDGKWFLLYCIPRTKRDPDRRPYFNTGLEKGA